MNVHFLICIHKPIILTLLLGVMICQSGNTQLESYNAGLDSAIINDVHYLKSKFQYLSLSGYIQAQYQLAQNKGILSFNGGNFAPEVDNRFMIRRGRMRIDYAMVNDKGKRTTYFAFQFDASERGVFMRDMFLRLYDTKYHSWIFTAGMFNRPFGAELQYSSSLRESPERGRMSQILMKTERDLGCMVTYKPYLSDKWSRFLQVDVGVFNGPGLTSFVDYDRFKDVIARISVNEINLSNTNWIFSGGLSYLNGGIGSKSQHVFKISDDHAIMKAETSINHLTERLPRTYKGADIKLKYNFGDSYFEWRAEYIFGNQIADANDSATPASLTGTPKYSRHFNGAYAYFNFNMQHKHLWTIKYDWYDPNTDVSGLSISSDKNFTPADVKFSTLGLGYTYFFNPQTKLLFYYEIPVNEKTQIGGYTEDIRDNTLTIRSQLLF